jgi:hypothetical protein
MARHSDSEMTQACQIACFCGSQPVGGDVHALDSHLNGFEDEIFHGHLLLLEILAVRIGTTSHQEPGSRSDRCVRWKSRLAGAPTQRCYSASTCSLDELSAGNVLSHMTSCDRVAFGVIHRTSELISFQTWKKYAR